MSYKPILPSSLLSVHGKEQNSNYTHEFNNYSLRIGVILKTYEIDDENNLLELAPEYDVAITEQDADRGITSTIYKNCQFLDTFGGIGDFLDIKRREPTSEGYKTDQDIEKYDGSTVLMLCADGISNKGIIIGAITNPNRKTTLTKEAGHHLQGEFNGVNWRIDKDGALRVIAKSATNNKGEPQDEEAGGSLFKIEKDGSVELSDGPLPEVDEEGNEVEQEDSGDEIKFEKIRMDKTNKTIDVESREDQSYKTDKNFNMEAKESQNVKLGKDLILEAEGKAAFSVKSTYDITADGQFKMSAQGVDISSKSQVNIKAQANFQAEAGAQVTIKAPLINMGQAISPALLATTFQSLGTGNLGGPVISIPINGISTQVFIS